MSKRLLLRDAENFSADMIQRVLGSMFWNLPAVGGVGTGYSVGMVGKAPTASTGHLAVTANGATMVLTMLSGWAQILRDAGASTYDPRILFAESDANDTATVTANATGSTRNDTVCLKVDMATAPTTDGSNLLSFVIIAGQNGGAVSNAPADGNLYLPLANVAVANGATFISQGNVTDLRLASLAFGVPILVPSYAGAPFPAPGGGSPPVKVDDKSGAAANYILTIPAGFRTVQLKWKLRDTSAVNGLGLIQVQYNGIVTSTYDSTEARFQGAVAMATPLEVLSAPQATLGLAAGGGLTNTNVYGVGSAEIPGYADANNEKSGIAHSSLSLGNNATGSFYESLVHFHARQTAAITTITLIPSNGTGWSAGSWAIAECHL